ncbi:hypothetical protein AUJ66_05045 [Candidatus Desantisbacteria bacterium CG1_02_38_46]|uniref:4Fe-4S ferredoxin-type domain-containing protein n=2 Tax=unclassified Candidatus Desantisiibacteriota TaxID=3106372 RepID=A0A1J4SBN7_9BACT|nr:MAG: hypothetical protein AUJ66_05045 [Candidatus Desantisbacteria bacterium CG1_02_38_46]
MESLYISCVNFNGFLKSTLEKKWEIYAPLKVMDSIRFEKIIDPAAFGGIIFDGVRTDQSVKSFFFHTKEIVATIPKSSISPVKFEKRIIMGVKGCDLHALKVFDKAYYEEGIIPEPFYKERRESTYVISSDCGYSLDSCFCTLLDSKPYPTEGFDLNFSTLKDGFIVEVGSNKGEELIKEMGESGAVLSDVTPVQMEEQKSNRDTLTKKLEEANREFQIPKKFDELCKIAFGSKIWKELADNKCVQCNGCLHICPTCYCFLLYDAKKDNLSERVRIWDACINAGYARVAGGANPRPTLQSRLRHRFFHKFLYFVQNFNMYACSGCGRCFKVCPGKIEIRETFRDINKEVKVKR